MEVNISNMNLIMDRFSRKLVLLLLLVIWQSSLGTTYALADLSNAMSVNLSLNGYAKFNNGLLVQWGRVGGSSTASYSVTMPTSFYNTEYKIFATVYKPSSDSAVYSSSPLAINKTVSRFYLNRNNLITKIMKYWKNGFYDEPVDGSVEITEEYYQELLAGQSTGLIIAESKNRYPILVEYEYDIEEAQKMKVSEIQSFDKSNSVNSFDLLGKSMWLDKSTRVGLFNSISIEKNVGKTHTTLWYDAVKYVIPIPNALAMLNALELYALNCYNVTQSHIAVVRSLQTIEEIENYDYTIGYPEKLSFPG